MDLVQCESRRGESIAPRPAQKDASMWIFVLEAGVALALLIFIVWWTLPSKKQDAPPQIEDKRAPAPRDSHDE